MDSLPDALIQTILSHMTNARDVAVCSCVCKRWNDSLPFIRSIYFPRCLFESYTGDAKPDDIILKILSMVPRLEQLIVYTPFSSAGLATWLKLVRGSLKHLELRMDSPNDYGTCKEYPSKMDCIGDLRNLESLKLWGVLMMNSPNWVPFQNLQSLEIVGAKLEDRSLATVLNACPNLKNLVLLGCEGLRQVMIEMPSLLQCNVDFHGAGNCSLSVTAPRLVSLEINGCSWIKIGPTNFLRHLSISNSSGRVYMLEVGEMPALETLSIRGVQWGWEAVDKILKVSSEVRHLYMKVEFTGNFDTLQPFPEIDFVDFFNNHPKLRKFDIHGAMFAALCQRNSLKNLESSFTIPCLEEVVITIRSPLNAEQKMVTLESLLQYAKGLKSMIIRILQMKSNHSSSDEFFEEICRFQRSNYNIVHIE